MARHFGVAAPDRTYIPGAKASWYFDHDPDTLFRYALDDVRETREISAALSPAFYVQTRIFPCRYQETALTDETTRIDWLMLREYLARRHSIPAPMAAESVAKKYTVLKVRGVSRPVLHCDVTALYPAVMLSDDLRPKADELGVFPELLRGLRDLREQAGQVADTAPATDAGRFLATARSGFKVLLDSFHDYLAFPAGHFNDFGAADDVTRAGGGLIRGLAARLEECGHGVVTVDTGGIYFVPRAGVGDAPVEEALAAEAASALPVEGRASPRAISGHVLLRAGEPRVAGRAGRSFGQRRRFERARARGATVASGWRRCSGCCCRVGRARPRRFTRAIGMPSRVTASTCSS